MKKTLGTLEKVELRDVWESENTDFTPWLAREENINILGQKIGLDLEVEAQENHRVGLDVHVRRHQRAGLPRGDLLGQPQQGAVAVERSGVVGRTVLATEIGAEVAAV